MLKREMFAVVFVLILHNHTIAQNSGGSAKDRTADDNVKTLLVSVLDKNSAPVRGLDKDNFSVVDDDVLQKIIAFGGEDQLEC